MSKPRVILAGGALVLICGLLLVWWSVRAGGIGTPNSPRISVLDADYPESEFYASASQEQLIELANSEVESLLRRFPNRPAASNVKANRDFLLSDMVAAEEAWKASLKLDPFNPDALLGLANLAFQDGRFDETIGLCEGLQRTNPGNPRVPLLLADAFMNSGRAELAVLALEQHILTEPTSVQALAMLGTAHLNNQRFALAIDWFQRVLKSAPDSKDAYYGLGQAYARQGESAKSAEAMRRFTELAQQKGQTNALEAQSFEDRSQAAHVAAQVFLDAGLVYKADGQLAAAEERILRAQRLQPDVVAWLEELQRVYQLQGERLPAVDVGQRLVTLSPQVVRYWLTLGSLYAELEQPEPAIAAFRKAIELAPDDPECQAVQSIIDQLN